MTKRNVRAITVALSLGVLGGCAAVADSVVEPKLRRANAKKYKQGSISGSEYSKRNRDIGVISDAVAELGK